MELLHTDNETYPSLIYLLATQYTSDALVNPGHIERGPPVTFQEGLPASLTRPGRALTAWLRWLDEDYPQRLLVEVLAADWLDVGRDFRGGFLAKLLRPLAIGAGNDNYLAAINEQIRALEQRGKQSADSAPPNSNANSNANSIANSMSAQGDDDSGEAWRQRRLAGYRVIRKLVRSLLESAPDNATPEERMAGAGRFLERWIRADEDLDRVAKAALLEQIELRREWIRRFELQLDASAWLWDLPARTRVMQSGPRPGYLHVAQWENGGQSNRRHLFVVGLDDRRFPGAALQDPILLDDERRRSGADLPTSDERLAARLEQFKRLVYRKKPLTLSWSSVELEDHREKFPCPQLVALFRKARRQPEANLEQMRRALGPAVSFAPRSAEEALDETEWWLATLTSDASWEAQHALAVEARYPNLRQGRLGLQARLHEFGEHSGCVPQAGADLNPFADDARACSATALETAGRCALAFFFRYGLHLLPPERHEPDPDCWLDPARAGSLMHEVFRRFMSELTGAGRLPSFEHNHRRLAKILAEEVRTQREQFPPPNENAFRTQYWQFIRIARIFLRDETVSTSDMPRYFELAMGLGEATAPPGQAEPVRIRLGPGKSIAARGQIDRVDQLDDHEYVVWDYKIGSAFGYDAGDPFREGRRVQSILYLRMLEAALRHNLDAEAVVSGFGYFFPSVRAHGLRVAWTAEQLRGGEAVLLQLGQLIANGSFPATSDQNDCRFCDHAAICGDTTGVTARSKQLLQSADIPSLQPFRELRRG